MNLATVAAAHGGAAPPMARIHGMPSREGGNPAG
jgi:hypothetical protein